MQKPTSIALVLGLLLVWGGTPTAFAQSDAEVTAAARSLFEAGMQAVDSGDYTTAADRLGRSVELRDSPVARTNLALALIELGHLVSASEHLRAVLRVVEPGTRVHALASTNLAEITPRLGRLRLVVTGAVDTVEVRLDGNAVPTALLGVEQPADPGDHTVTLHRGERGPLASMDVTILSGRTSAVTLDAPPLTDEELAVGVVGSSGESRGVEEEPWFWTMLAIIVIGGGVGLTVGLLVANPTRDYVLGDSGVAHPTLLEWP